VLVRLALGASLAVSASAAGFPNPFTIRPWDIRLPGSETPEGVQVHENLAYTNDHARKHHLDFYAPAGKQGFPVVLFLHGGAWRVGDKSLYRGLGNRLAKSGIGVAIPSYRLMGIVLNRHPAQVEDAAEAFAWVRQHAGEFGGDPSRIYVAGHSSGGHMASLLGLDRQYLARHDLDPSAIRGVISISGVYNVDRLLVFHARGKKKLASPMRYVHRGAPPFLVAYCQWDFVTLPGQARKFAKALRKAGGEVELVRVSGDNHISEIVNITREHGPLIDAVLRFVE
jgi:acetyl esterase/lipase